MKRQVWGIGEIVYDIVFKNNKPIESKPGGAILNSLISLSRLNINTSLISDSVNDEIGKIIKTFLIENNVDVNFINWYKNGKSRLALAFLNENNDANYQFYKIQSNESLKINYPITNNNDIILFGSYYGIKPEIISDLQIFIKKSVIKGNIIIYDPNFRKSHLSMLEVVKPFIYENFILADVVKGSNEDFYHIFGLSDPTEIYNKFCSVGGKILILTYAEKGVWFFHPKFQFHFKVPKINPVSTIGAGDSFSSGIIYGLLNYKIEKKDIFNIKQNNWEQIIKIASNFSTAVCLSYENYVPIDFNIVKE